MQKKVIKRKKSPNTTSNKTNIQKVKAIYNWEEQEKILLDVYKGLI